MSDSYTEELPIVMGLTGASGAIYAVRTLQWLLQSGCDVRLVVSPDGLTVIRQELQFDHPVNVESLAGLFHSVQRLLHGQQGSTARAMDQDFDVAVNAAESGKLTVYQPHDYFTPIASGSFQTRAMVICPCSGSTVAAIAHSNGRNLVHRAAEVHLKERRKLIVVPRETPVSSFQLENLLRLSREGVVVLPASPGWYHGVGGLADLVDFIAGRILDQLGIAHQRVRRWS